MLSIGTYRYNNFINKHVRYTVPTRMHGLMSEYLPNKIHDSCDQRVIKVSSELTLYVIMSSVDNVVKVSHALPRAYTTDL